MKALTGTRSEVWWLLASLPAVMVGHWIAVTVGPVLARWPLVEAVRGVLNLL